MSSRALQFARNRLDVLREGHCFGEILYFEESKRRVLDFYRNAIVHFMPEWLKRDAMATAKKIVGTPSSQLGGRKVSNALAESVRLGVMIPGKG